MSAEGVASVRLCLYICEYCILNFCCQVKEDTELFIIDEVGKMELYSASFFPAVLKVLESNIPILATIPIPKFGRDIPGGTIIFLIRNVSAFLIAFGRNK